MRQKKLPFTVIADSNRRIATDYNAPYVPHLVLISPDGAVLLSHTGYLSGDEKKLEQKLKTLFTR